jgi:hypothetical protein
MLDVRARAASRSGGVRVWRVISFGGVAVASLWCAASAGATLATASFMTPGLYSFTVPSGVSSVQITAVGASGGGAIPNGAGGVGSSVGGVTSAGKPLAVTVPVTPDEQLNVAVGANGAHATAARAAAGGFGGGAAGGFSGSGYGGGGGGGGASVVSFGSPFPWSVLVVAAGGGGAGGDEPGGFNIQNGGNGDSPVPCTEVPSIACPILNASPGTMSAGGAGGAPLDVGSGGQPGQFGAGGAGGAGPTGGGRDANDGGGGGGGYYGGGGGGPTLAGVFAGGGGAGGSSFVTSLASTSGPPAPAGPAQVLISYALSGAPVGLSQGAPGQTELVRCNTTITRTVTSHGPKHKLTVQKCTTRFLRGPVKLTAERGDLAASISRGAVRYATGLAAANGHGGWRLALTHRSRALRRGLYTLTLKTRSSHPRIIKRTTISLS